ncbi:MAG: MFS transporter [Acidobacteria bacterium 13_1_40CM_4_57_6]|nr:MAG: MFS transporter [Acidobacteria bacterium 13_1_40CM_4_57_6]
MASDTNLTAVRAAAPAETGEKTVFKILLTISFCHLLNDTIQSLIPPIYPLLQKAFHFNYWQVGRIALTSQLTASILQPLVGLYTDRRPKPYSLAVGMGITMIGLLAFAMAPSYGTILAAAALVGIGSAVFHPESSRIARMASGGQHGMAQSLFQVGGNAGSAMGPLLAWAFISGQSSIAWFSLLALIAIVLLTNIGTWFRNHPLHLPKPIIVDSARAASAASAPPRAVLAPKNVAFALAVLLALMFSKFFYLASLLNYYTFYLMGKFHLTVQSAQLHLFLFLAAAAAGTYIGGPVGDKIGRKYVIWVSILGVLPFTLLLPYANLFWTSTLSVVIGFIIASAFSAILVYAQELMPGRIGLVSGLFFGLAFGLGGIGAALLGKLADLTDINFVYRVCSFLPAIGILTALLPNLEPAKTAALAQQKSPV